MFSEMSIWTMVHGIGLSGGALLAMAAAIFYLMAVRPADAAGVSQRQVRMLVGVIVASAVALWLSVIVGTYVIFPAYRVTPPDGVTDLTAFPRALIMADAENRWLHTYAMETKEHVPWIAIMLATAVAAVAIGYGRRVLSEPKLRRATVALLGTSFILVAYVGLLGIFINKFAPVE